MIDPKQIQVIFKSEKQKKSSIHFHTSTKLYILNFSMISDDIICAKWLIYYFLCQVDFSAALKWRPGTVPPCPP